jgi:hypothetical protein
MTVKGSLLRQKVINALLGAEDILGDLEEANDRTRAIYQEVCDAITALDGWPDEDAR